MQVWWVLMVAEDIVTRVTYDAQCTDKLFGWLNTSRDDHLDKVGRNANDKNHAKGLQDADTQEHLAQRHGSVAGDRHICGVKVVSVGDAF
jgi:hypothetical protein